MFDTITSEEQSKGLSTHPVGLGFASVASEVRTCKRRPPPHYWRDVFRLSVRTCSFCMCKLFIYGGKKLSPVLLQY